MSNAQRLMVTSLVACAICVSAVGGYVLARSDSYQASQDYIGSLKGYIAKLERECDRSASAEKVLIEEVNQLEELVRAYRADADLEEDAYEKYSMYFLEQLTHFERELADAHIAQTNNLGR